jgi:hypothetical protein
MLPKIIHHNRTELILEIAIDKSVTSSYWSLSCCYQQSSGYKYNPYYQYTLTGTLQNTFVPLIVSMAKKFESLVIHLSCQLLTWKSDLEGS